MLTHLNTSFSKPWFEQSQIETLKPWVFECVWNLDVRYSSPCCIQFMILLFRLAGYQCYILSAYPVRDLKITDFSDKWTRVNKHSSISRRSNLLTH